MFEKLKEFFHTENPLTHRPCLSYDFLRKLFKHNDVSVFLAWDLTPKEPQVIVVTDLKTRTVTYHKPRWCISDDDLKRAALSCFRNYQKHSDLTPEIIDAIWVQFK